MAGAVLSLKLCRCCYLHYWAICCSNPSLRLLFLINHKERERERGGGDRGKRKRKVPSYPCLYVYIYLILLYHLSDTSKAMAGEYRRLTTRTANKWPGPLCVWTPAFSIIIIIFFIIFFFGLFREVLDTNSLPKKTKPYLSASARNKVSWSYSLRRRHHIMSFRVRPSYR